MNAIEVRGVVKQYPLVRALDSVDFSLKKGEIHSLLGENGAGKSTLMKVLYGMCTPDTGKLLIDGKEIQLKTPRQAIELGIGMVHQHFMLVPAMTVTENIIAGDEPLKGIVLDMTKARRQISEMIDQYGFSISPDAKISSLSVGEQQKVEILKAIYRDANIIIMDEPTAVLTPQEVAELFDILRDLKSKGKSIIIITHKLKETLEIADRMSILRDGKMVKSGLAVESATAEQIAGMMVGREVNLGMVKRSRKVGEAALEAMHITLKKDGREILKGLSITVHQGEILGVAGIEGNGQTELIEVLTGLRQADEAKIKLNGKEICGGADAFIKSGIGHVPEDRMTRGLVLELSIADNLLLGYHRREKFSHKGIFSKSKVHQYSKEMVKEFGIKAPDASARCNELSGGNQQKVIIARVISENPDVLIVAQPTRGVDIGAMEYIHNRLIQLRDQGKAILLISADLDEVRKLSDRICVIFDGQIVAEGSTDQYSDMELGLMMTGAVHEGRENTGGKTVHQ